MRIFINSLLFLLIQISFSQNNLKVKIIFKNPSLEGKSISINCFDVNYLEGGTSKNYNSKIKNGLITYEENFSNEIATLQIYLTDDPSHYFYVLAESNMSDVIVELPLPDASIFSNIIYSTTSNNTLYNLMRLKREYYFDKFSYFTDDTKKYKTLSKESKMSLVKEQLKIIKDFDKNTYYALYFMAFESGDLDYNYEIINDVFQNLPANIKNSELGLQFETDLNNFKENANKSDVGVAVPTFEVLNDSNQIFNNNSLKDTVYLIAFSATWCSACKIYEKNLVKLYSEFKDKGFEVVYFNQDENVNRWFKEIKKKNLNWINVSERVKSSKSLIAKKFNIKALPEYFLINKNGRIIYNSIELKEIDFNVIKKLLEKNL